MWKVLPKTSFAGKGARALTEGEGEEGRSGQKAYFSSRVESLATKRRIGRELKRES